MTPPGIEQQEAKPAPISYSVKRALEETGVGLTFLYGELKAGRLKAKKAGRSTLIGHDELKEWFKNLPDYAPAGETDDE